MEVFFSIKSSLSSGGSEQILPLVNYLSQSSNGLILITTRDKQVGERVAYREKPIMVLPMTEPEAERLLWSKAAQEVNSKIMKSSKLLKILGYLSLTITQATAYVSE